MTRKSKREVEHALERAEARATGHEDADQSLEDMAPLTVDAVRALRELLEDAAIDVEDADGEALRHEITRFARARLRGDVAAESDDAVEAWVDRRRCAPDLGEPVGDGPKGQGSEVPGGSA